MAARQFSFTSFQANNPTAPPPGDRLDGEFDRLARTLAAQAPPPPAKIGKNQLEPGLFDQIGASILARVEAIAASAQTLLGEARAIALGTLAAAGVARAQNALAQDAAQRSSAEAQAASSSAADAAASADQAEAFYVETGNAARDTAGDVAICQDYGVLTQAWAEHLPDPIPPNILAVMGVTGDHWSSRFWANQAAQTVAGLFPASWTVGSVPFAISPTALGQDSANFYWDDVNNRLGIGTTGPTNVLDVNSGANIQVARFRSTASGIGGGYVMSYDATSVLLSGGVEYVGSAWTARATTASQLSLNSGNLGFFGDQGLTVGSTYTPTSRMIILGSSGNVGIGTTGPGAKLHVSSVTDPSAIALVSGTARGVRIGVDGAGNAAISGVDQTGSVSFQPLVVGGSTTTLSAGGTAALTVAVGGNIGIGTTGPNATLDVRNSAATATANFFNAGSGIVGHISSAVDGSSIALINGTARGVRVGIDGGGNAAITGVDNTGSASFQPLVVGGSTVTLSSGGTAVLTASSGVVVGAPTGGALGAGKLNAVEVRANNVVLTSDADLKTGIEKLAAALPIVAAIEPKQFKWLPLPELPPVEGPDGEMMPAPARPPDFTDRLNRGFLAQDVAGVLGGKAGDGVDLGGMVAVLWQAVREMSDKIAVLEARKR